MCIRDRKPAVHASKTSATAPKHSPSPAGAASTPGAFDEEKTMMKYTNECLQRERDFYFAKLRSVEIMCVEAKKAPADLTVDGIISELLKILYATDTTPVPVPVTTATAPAATELPK
eukprot:TRINITY_DN19993_c0_g1_i1.p1 TRINITY_DN19993_c0_g1~~TRINITY_DN19993_c0_g1_i1.p1  ORF type:complete len:130 (+),score=31.28 TRINITY_DN19993_c0_g1_i1:42-392(+)